MPSVLLGKCLLCATVSPSIRWIKRKQQWLCLSESCCQIKWVLYIKYLEQDLACSELHVSVSRYSCFCSFRPMKTPAINLQSTETWLHLRLQLVKQSLSSTWGNNTRRGNCDPWTRFSHKMRCLIKPTSFWAHRADERGEHGAWEVWSQGHLPAAGAGSRSGHGPEGQAGAPPEAACPLPAGSGCHRTRILPLREEWPRPSPPSILDPSCIYRPRSEDRMLGRMLY